VNRHLGVRLTDRVVVLLAVDVLYLQPEQFSQCTIHIHLTVVDRVRLQLAVAENFPIIRSIIVHLVTLTDFF
jgi:hypothetical protein